MEFIVNNFTSTELSHRVGERYSAVHPRIRLQPRDPSGSTGRPVRSETKSAADNGVGVIAAGIVRARCATCPNRLSVASVRNKTRHPPVRHTWRADARFRRAKLAGVEIRRTRFNCSEDDGAREPSPQSRRPRSSRRLAKFGNSWILLFFLRSSNPGANSRVFFRNCCI